jgi:hypothetical protein
MSKATAVDRTTGSQGVHRTEAEDVERAASIATVRELDHRRSAGVHVTLLWETPTNQILVAVTDERSGESITFDVNPGEARRAFEHPYVYAAGAPERQPSVTSNVA